MNAQAYGFTLPREIDAVVPFGSGAYLLMVLVVAFARGADLFSTWVATPTLELEANPIARLLGWRLGVGVNLVLALTVAILPLAALSITTTSLMVAARNLQSAWLIRSMGEHAYADWIARCYLVTRPGLFLGLLLLHAGCIACVGAGLMLFSEWQLVPFAAGFGIIVYAIAVVFFTSLSMIRTARRRRQRAAFEARFAPDDPH